MPEIYQKYGKDYYTTHKIHLNVLEEFVLNDLRADIQSIDNLKEFLNLQHFSATKVKKASDSEIRKIE